MNHLNPITTEEAILCIQLRNQSGFLAAEQRLAEKMKPAKLQPVIPATATLDPMANEDRPDYMPTVEVVRIVRDQFGASYLRHVAKRYLRRITLRHGCPDALVNGLALEIACREILNANWRTRAAPTAQTR